MNTQVLMWLGAVMIGLIATAVLGALGWAAAWSVALAWEWLRRDRVTSLLEDDDGMPYCEKCGTWHRWSHEDYPDSPPPRDLLGLPPERTWEQMTSHQLPATVDGHFLRKPGYLSPAERKHWHRLERNRKRCAGRAEMTWRAHYAAMGLDYPSGLMARVREHASV